MKKEDISKALAELKKVKRGFKQTVDLIYSFKGLDLKKTDNHLDFSVILHNPKGKKIKIAALVGHETKASAEENCDTVIVAEDFPKYAKDKKALKKIATEHDFFIAQADLMAKVASNFGKVLGPKGKMPNPKMGCVVPPKANLKPLAEQLQNTVRITVKSAPMVQLRVGKEDQPEEELIDNILTLDDGIAHHLPGGRAQIRHIMLKLTMSKPIKLE